MHSDKKPAVIGFTALLLTLLLLATAVPADADTLKSSPTPTLDPFLDQFARITSVHVEAEVILQLETPAGTRSGRGSFSYWEQGDRFRIRCETDEELGLMDDVEWSYDGETSRLWLLESNTISDNTSLDRKAPTALPNPFFLPTDFLHDHESCPTCRASLERVVQRSAGWDGLLVRDGLEWRLEKLGPDGEPSLLVELAHEPQMWVPRSIVRTLPGEGGRVTVELEKYQPTDGLLFPRVLSVRTWSAEADATLHMEILVTELEIDRPLPAAAFSDLGDEQTTFIFSGDEERDVSTP